MVVLLAAILVSQFVPLRGTTPPTETAATPEPTTPPTAEPTASAPILTTQPMATPPAPATEPAARPPTTTIEPTPATPTAPNTLATPTTPQGQYEMGEDYFYGLGATDPTATAPTVSTTPAATLATPTTPQGQYAMGENYFYGLGGVSKDPEQAIVWYRKAADQGYSKAQSTLGKLYENGWGVQQDYKQARILVPQGRRSGRRIR